MEAGRRALPLATRDTAFALLRLRQERVLEFSLTEAISRALAVLLTSCFQWRKRGQKHVVPLSYAPDGFVLEPPDITPRLDDKVRCKHSSVYVA